MSRAIGRGGTARKRGMPSQASLRMEHLMRMKEGMEDVEERRREEIQRQKVRWKRFEYDTTVPVNDEIEEAIRKRKPGLDVFRELAAVIGADAGILRKTGESRPSPQLPPRPDDVLAADTEIPSWKREVESLVAKHYLLIEDLFWWLVIREKSMLPPLDDGLPREQVPYEELNKLYGRIADRYIILSVAITTACEASRVKDTTSRDRYKSYSSAVIVRVLCRLCWALWPGSKDANLCFGKGFEGRVANIVDVLTLGRKDPQRPDIDPKIDHLARSTSRRKRVGDRGSKRLSARSKRSSVASVTSTASGTTQGTEATANNPPSARGIAKVPRLLSPALYRMDAVSRVQLLLPSARSECGGYPPLRENAYRILGVPAPGPAIAERAAKHDREEKEAKEKEAAETEASGTKSESDSKEGAPAADAATVKDGGGNESGDTTSAKAASGAKAASDKPKAKEQPKLLDVEHTKIKLVVKEPPQRVTREPHVLLYSPLALQQMGNRYKAGWFPDARHHGVAMPMSYERNKHVADMDVGFEQDFVKYVWDRRAKTVRPIGDVMSSTAGDDLRNSLPIEGGARFDASLAKSMKRAISAPALGYTGDSTWGSTLGSTFRAEKPPTPKKSAREEEQRKSVFLTEAQVSEAEAKAEEEESFTYDEPSKAMEIVDNMAHMNESVGAAFAASVVGVRRIMKRREPELMPDRNVRHVTAPRKKAIESESLRRKLHKKQAKRELFGVGSTIDLKKSLLEIRHGMKLKKLSTLQDDNEMMKLAVEQTAIRARDFDATVGKQEDTTGLTAEEIARKKLNKDREREALRRVLARERKMKAIRMGHIAATADDEEDKTEEERYAEKAEKYFRARRFLPKDGSIASNVGIAGGKGLIPWRLSGSSQRGMEAGKRLGMHKNEIALVRRSLKKQVQRSKMDEVKRRAEDAARKKMPLLPKSEPKDVPKSLLKKKDTLIVADVGNVKKRLADLMSAHKQAQHDLAQHADLDLDPNIMAWRVRLNNEKKKYDWPDPPPSTDLGTPPPSSHGSGPGFVKVPRPPPSAISTVAHITMMHYGESADGK